MRELWIFKDVFPDQGPVIHQWDEPEEREFDGKKVMGRPTRGFGDATFKYAGKTYEPTPWEQAPDVLDLKVKSEKLLKEKMGKEIEFSFCLCGLYSDGETAIPHHSDTVPTLEDVVVGVSFGAPRILEWTKYEYQIKKHPNTSEVDLLYGDNFLKTTPHLLEDGDVYVFDGYSQMYSTHAIPTMKKVGARVNFTFRSGV